MTFADLPAGETIFLDANPLVYHFAADPVFGPASNQLIARIENQEIQAFTSTHVLSETAHHLMTLEASSVFGWRAGRRAGEQHGVLLNFAGAVLASRRRHGRINELFVRFDEYRMIHADSRLPHAFCGW